MAELKMPKAKNNAPAIPSKKTMNFVHHVSSFNPRKVIPIVVLILLVAGVFVKAGIMDPLDQKAAAYAALAQKQEQLAAVNARLAGYDELHKQYGRYSYGWMNESEVNLVTRMDALSLVEKKIAVAAEVDNLAINNNVLTMNIHGITLEQASAMVKSLEDSELVESAYVYNAVAEETGDRMPAAEAEEGEEAAEEPGEIKEAKIFMTIVLTKEAE